MEEFKPNSHKSKEHPPEEPKTKVVAKVVDGPVKRRKKGVVTKFLEAIVSESVESVQNYIWEDIVIPRVRDLVYDTFDNTVERLLYGENGRGRAGDSRTSYRSYYRHERDRHDSMRRNQVRYTYDDVILDNRGDAEEVLFKLEELIDQYGSASVADLYDMVGVSGNWTDNKYGWRDIHSVHRADVIQVRDGYKIRLPRALPLD